jgi:crotonobetainyl-CoA:carnitine CoA-transferase CaiB-like acyl-CoA transferase
LSEPLLQSVRVIDLTTVVFGPLATQVLADYGADVIKIEPPEGDVMRHNGVGATGGMGPIFLNLNRGKRSVVIDLKREEGKDLLRTLIGKADVLIHNVRRKAIDRLGFSYQAVRAMNPSILYCAATGFAATSRRADAGAIDDVIQSAAGLAALNADREGVPRLVESLVADKLAGLSLACAVLAGLYRQKSTGVGGTIDLPMYETLASFLLVEHLQGHTFVPPKGGIGYHRLIGRGRRIYRAKDGYVSLAPYSTSHWTEFFKAAGRPDLATDPRVNDRVQRNIHIADLYDLIGGVVGERTVAEWEALAARIGFPAQGVRTLEDVANDPELASTGVLIERAQAGVGRARALASPGFFDNHPARHPGSAPLLGQHTAEVLREMGISADAIHRYAADGVIHQ